MQRREEDTIVALASAPGRSAVAILRISGPDALSAAQALAGPYEFLPRTAHLRTLRDPENGEVIDQGLVLWFPAPASFTGEAMIELQVHGGRAILASLLKILTERQGIRLAEPGEFTRRAFENGKLDLTRVEAIADLIDAETEAQRRQAARQLGGALGAKAAGWRSEIIRASAYLEAAIDFTEETPEETSARAAPILRKVADEIEQALADSGAGERVRAGLSAAIIGPPNAGKSSLLNALAKREVAIVAAQPGTTRDIIEVGLDLAGLPVVLTDTAGLREAGDSVEQEGIRRARASAEAADIRLWVWDSSLEPVSWQQLKLEPGAHDILLLSKRDLAPQATPPAQWPGLTLRISVKTGEGVSALIEALADRAARLLNPGTDPLVTRARHRQELASAQRALSAALAAPPQRVELMAEDLRHAARALGRITGEVDVEDILDAVFAEFCLGK